MKCMFTFFVLSIPRSGDLLNILWHTGFVYPGSLYDTMFHTKNASLANRQTASVKRLRPENNGLYLSCYSCFICWVTLYTHILKAHTDPSSQYNSYYTYPVYLAIMICIWTICNTYNNWTYSCLTYQCIVLEVSTRYNCWIEFHAATYVLVTTNS